MLPAGVTGHAAPFGEQTLLREHLPGVQTMIELRRGPCGCDFFMQRDPAGRTDETRLRERGIRAGIPRREMAVIIETHRQSAGRARPLEEWQRALAEFVAEHARNAGPSLYHRRFTPGGRKRASDPGDPARVPVSRVRAAPGEWLADDRLTLVVRD